MNKFDYYYGAEAEQFNFFRIPKKLIRDKAFSGISCEAKILYGLLLDRMTLSLRNGWVDEYNRVYIIFAICDIMDEFGCSKRKAIRLLEELDDRKGIGLVEKKRQGLGKPSLLYVRNFNFAESGESDDAERGGCMESPPEQEIAYEDTYQEGMNGDQQMEAYIPDISEGEILKNEDMEVQGQVYPSQKCQNVHLQKCQNVHLQKCQNVHPNKTDNSKTEYIYTNPSIHPSIPPDGTDGITGESMPLEGFWEDRQAVLSLLRKNLDYSALIADLSLLGEKEWLDNLTELMADACCCPGEYQAIGGMAVQTAEIRRRFLRLRMPHIRYVQESLEKNNTEIKNIRAYLLACLYNAPLTMGSYYAASVQHDLAYGLLGKQRIPSGVRGHPPDTGERDKEDAEEIRSR